MFVCIMAGDAAPELIFAESGSLRSSDCEAPKVTIKLVAGKNILVTYYSLTNLASPTARPRPRRPLSHLRSRHFRSEYKC